MQFYGLTETSGPYAYIGSNKNELKSFADVEVKIENNSEILIKGNRIFTGYVCNQNPLINGFFTTGDQGTVDEAGNIKIHGRKK